MPHERSPVEQVPHGGKPARDRHESDEKQGEFDRSLTVRFADKPCTREQSAPCETTRCPYRPLMPFAIASQSS